MAHHIMPVKRTASKRNADSAEIFVGNNTASQPPQIRMQTRNGACTTVDGVSVGAQNAPATNGSLPETLIPQPPRVGTLEVECRRAIQMLTQLVAAQLGVMAQHQQVLVLMTSRKRRD
ncbi:hypothetical protein HAX54_048270 [Datura stramonium]|uniref:Uncharacterized protein n=1 Tax=Datura stramonium TaxID=4076 RepID=A0ABS8STN4_DATST|nr:hypothetical protein [Datura stramonium]